MIMLSKDQVLLLHKQLIKATGGSVAIRDEELLESALFNPFQSFDGEELSDTILALASGEIGAEEILQWIKEHQR
ncbi:MAG: hypothetical protein SO170_06000 [Butyribacter sp.]|nr:hypothetical protein [bacterium]MDY3854491.1 hypothetical protein [Butyribacter sp.]